jgi:uncharacterized protein involved in exopolysaccharide biosynthesis
MAPDRIDVAGAAQSEAERITLLDVAVPLAQNLKLLFATALAAGLLALGVTYVIAPTYTARSTFLPPQQQQSAAASTLASIGALAGLVGAAGGIKSPADQYVSLIQSATVSDRLIEQFELMKVYDKKYRVDARKVLRENVRVSLGKKDGVISIEVDDEDPKRAAALANAHVDELRRLTSRLALTEAQQRRIFFEAQLDKTRESLTKAQRALQASGISAGALKAEPKAAAEGYARLKAEATGAEVRLQALRRTLVDDAPEVQQQLATLAALRAQLARAEQATESSGGPDYVGKYRDFKYHETLFELFARQYELARLDESREGTLIQVVDTAVPPEKRTRPKRVLTSVAVALGTLVLAAVLVALGHFWRQSASKPHIAAKLTRLRAALSKR